MFVVLTIQWYPQRRSNWTALDSLALRRNANTSRPGSPAGPNAGVVPLSGCATAKLAELWASVRAHSDVPQIAAFGLQAGLLQVRGSCTAPSASAIALADYFTLV
jgi:hypothetical protein